MIALPRTPIGRIALAIALSLMAHMIVLFAPLVRLPPSEMPPPILAARLEPLPKIAAEPVPARKLKPKPRPALAVPEAAQPQDVVQLNDKLPAASQPEAPQVDRAPPTVGAAEEEVKPAHPLPRHAQLTFTAYKGTDFQVGEARHRLEIDDDKSYMIKVSMNTTGLASIFKSYASDQQSSGILTAQGLRPGNFSETKNTSKGKETLEAKFSWEEKVLSFSSGNSMPLPEQTQDIISFLYQLSQLALDKGVIPMYISNGKKLERYELAVGEEEYIQTVIGRLRALPLRKIHAQGEEGLDIWLGMEYRLFPVKIRQIDRTGQIAGEMVISEIRVSDE